MKDQLNNTLVFTANHKKTIVKASYQPTIELQQIEFLTEDLNWAQRLRETYLRVIIEEFNKNGNALRTVSQAYFIGGLISPFHIRPILYLNQSLSIDNELPFYSEIADWKISVDLGGLEFKTNESLVCEYNVEEEILQSI